MSTCTQYLIGPNINASLRNQKEKENNLFKFCIYLRNFTAGSEETTYTIPLPEAVSPALMSDLACTHFPVGW